MDRFVIRENISRFERLLAAESDPDRQTVLLALLDEQRQKLAAQDGRASFETPLGD